MHPLVLALHGSSLCTVDAITKEGGKTTDNEYKGVGHDSWTRTYSASETWNWLFKQKRKQ